MRHADFVGFMEKRIFGLPGDAALAQKVAETSQQLRFMHSQSNVAKMRTYTSFEHRSSMWSQPCLVIARIEASMQHDPTPDNSNATRQEAHVRYVVTSLDGDAERLYEGVYSQRGEAKNLISPSNSTSSGRYYKFYLKVIAAHLIAAARK